MTNDKNGIPVELPGDEINRITNAIIEVMSTNTVTIEDGMTVLCNLAGQLVAQLALGQPNNIQQHTENVAANIAKIAHAKLTYDDEQRRKGN